MELFKIAVVFAATCSIASTYTTGRFINQYSKTKIRTSRRWNWIQRQSCTEQGFHPPIKADAVVPSVSVDMVPAGSTNTSLSVTCYKPGEIYDGKVE